MKKLIFAVLAMLVLVSNAYSQALSPYEKKCLDLDLAFIKNVISVRTKYATVQSDRVDIADLTRTYNGFTALPDNKSKVRSVDNFMNSFLYGLVYLTAALSFVDSFGFSGALSKESLMTKEYERMLEKLEKDKKTAESLMNPAELKKVRDEKYGNRYFYSTFFSSAEKYFSQKAPEKGEFETTDAFNRRINAFYDSTAIIFKEYSLKETEQILHIIDNYGKFYLDNYNADRGVYSVKAIIDKKIQVIPL